MEQLVDIPGYPSTRKLVVVDLRGKATQYYTRVVWISAARNMSWPGKLCCICLLVDRVVAARCM